MVEITDIITPDGIILDLKNCNSKRQVLKELSQQAAATLGIDPQHLLEALMERERLGTTGIGHGIAIPHARLAGLDHLVGLFARLEQPVDFESLDDQPSDLIFLLLAPIRPTPTASRRSPASRACSAIPGSASGCARNATATRCTAC